MPNPPPVTTLSMHDHFTFYMENNKCICTLSTTGCDSSITKILTYESLIQFYSTFFYDAVHHHTLSRAANIGVYAVSFLNEIVS